MPIKPENRALYGEGWKEFSAYIRFDRAEGRCECRGECNHDHGGRCEARHGLKHPVTGSRVVLTVAHRNHNPAERGEHEVFAACQRCHLAYDRPYHIEQRKKTAENRKALEKRRQDDKTATIAFAIECGVL